MKGVARFRAELLGVCGGLREKLFRRDDMMQHPGQECFPRREELTAKEHFRDPRRRERVPHDLESTRGKGYSQRDFGDPELVAPARANPQIGGAGENAAARDRVAVDGRDDG